MVFGETLKMVEARWMSLWISLVAIVLGIALLFIFIQNFAVPQYLTGTFQATKCTIIGFELYHNAKTNFTRGNKNGTAAKCTSNAKLDPFNCEVSTLTAKNTSSSELSEDMCHNVKVGLNIHIWFSRSISSNVCM